MRYSSLTMGGKRVLVMMENAPRVESERDVDALIVACREYDTSWVALRGASLHDDFFRLETGMAGHVVQKLINYGLHVAVVGDITAWLGRSRALRAWVNESNRGNTFWFVADLNELERRLAAAAQRSSRS